MRPEVMKLLVDVRDAADAIVAFTDGKQLADMTGDPMLRSALYYQFVIIGEALSQLRSVDINVLETVTEYRRIIAFRNQVGHGYAKIDDEITWRIVQDKVPVLRADTLRLLGE